MGSDIKTNQDLIDLEEVAKQKHLPFDWREILNKGLKLFDYTNKETPVILLKSFPAIEKPAYFLLIGENNLKTLKDPNYRFFNVIEYLNAVELYHYTCLTSNKGRQMDDFYITIVDPTQNGFAHIIALAFRRYISR